ncbi:DUF177 domain-containing protein [Motilibacter sp. K478]|nr:DUF177 domain-containing protein [Motilibacter aurantiacus]
MRRVSRTVAAPEGLGIDVLSIPVGAELDLELRLEAVMEGVLVSGTARAAVTGECVRCLDPLEQQLEVSFQELYAYPESSSAEADEDEVRLLEGDLLDVEPVVRDAVVLALPLQPVCTEDCPGLCADCGARLADEPGHGHDVVDARWAALGGLLAGGAPERPQDAADTPDQDGSPPGPTGRR